MSRASDMGFRAIPIHRSFGGGNLAIGGIQMTSGLSTSIDLLEVAIWLLEAYR